MIFGFADDVLVTVVVVVAAGFLVGLTIATLGVIAGLATELSWLKDGLNCGALLSLGLS